MYAPAKHTSVPKRQNVPLHTCKRINEHANTPRERQGECSRGVAIINQHRIIVVAQRVSLHVHWPVCVCVKVCC